MLYTGSQCFSITFIVFDLRLAYQFLPKVGHSFRDRKAQVAHHIAMNLKTRDQLLEEGIELIDYVELVTPPSSTRELVVNHFAYPPGYIEKPGRKLQAKTNRPSIKHLTAIDAASNVLNLSSKPLRLVHGAISKTGELSMRVSSGAAEEVLTKKAVATRMTEHQDDFATQHGNNRTQVQAAHNFSMQPTTEGIPTLAQTLPSTTRMGTPEKQIGKRYFISLADIVVPTLQEGHEMLPIAGGWTFFPLPEFRSKKVDLGTHAKGWQLQLAPVSTEEESILLNVPARFILNGCHNPLKSFAANKI